MVKVLSGVVIVWVSVFFLSEVFAAKDEENLRTGTGVLVTLPPATRVLQISGAALW